MSEERRCCLVIDNQPVVRLGVRDVLGDRYEVEEAEDARDALKLLTAIGDFDVAIIAITPSPGGNGAESTAAIRALRKARPGLGIVAHGARPERYAAAEAFGAGATAYVAKNSEPAVLSQAVDAAAEAQTFIDPAATTDEARERTVTRRQRQILQLFAEGQSTAEAAKRLGLSTETIRTHTKALLSRLGAHHRAHAVAIGMRIGLIE